MIRTIVLTLSMALAVIVPAMGKVAHFLVVDEAGRPLPGVRAQFSWTATSGSFKGRLVQREYLSDSLGRFHPDDSFPCNASFEKIKKDGYSFASYLVGHVKHSFVVYICNNCLII